MAVARERLIGHWDGDPCEIAFHDTIRLWGWAHINGGELPRVVASRDGEVLADVAANLERPDVADALHLPAGTPLGWEIELALDFHDRNCVIEVACIGRRQRISLGLRQVCEVRPPTIGRIDSPVDGQRCRPGGVLWITGWSLFDGRPAAAAHACLDGGPARPLRMGTPSPGRAAALGLDAHEPTADAGGFNDVIPIDASWAGQTLTLRVDTTSLDGRTQTLGPVSVVVGEVPSFPAMPAAPLLRAIAAAPRSRHSPPIKRTRVCAFTHQLDLGGGELYLSELLFRLADSELDILLVSPYDGVLRKPLEQAGIAVHITREYAYDASHYEAGVTELAALLRAWDADVALANTLGVFPPVDAALTLGIPTLWAIHESFPLETFSYMNWGDTGLHPEVHARWLFCLSHAKTLFESQSTLDLLLRQVPDLDARVVRYGIDLQRIATCRASRSRSEQRRNLGFHPEDLVFLCMGVMQERKAQLSLVLAFAEVASSNPNARLVLVGDRPCDYADAVRGLVQSLGLEGRIVIEPIQADTYQWYLAADVLVSASDTESLPRSVMEAMAFGRPVLAANVFGVSDIVTDGANGWLCSPYSRASLVAGLRRVLATTPSDLQQMSKRCLDDAAAFDARQYATVYSAMIADAAAAVTVAEKVATFG